ncbi:MAG TPA: hypothetical protein PKY88_11320 [Anaerohalosphaeraceae bacterium]|nr:hypothetical protein [Anaerohalosphaeraceae bacterium]
MNVIIEEAEKTVRETLIVSAVLVSVLFTAALFSFLKKEQCFPLGGNACGGSCYGYPPVTFALRGVWFSSRISFFTFGSEQDSGFFIYLSSNTALSFFFSHLR